MGGQASDDFGGVSTLEYCDVEGGHPGTGNINLDPLLTLDGHLTLNSPCIDHCPAGPGGDMDGETRPFGGSTDYDIGADEFIDTDADGLPDRWEFEHYGDTTTAAPASDEEPDGLTNLDEYPLGTDPLDADTDGDGLEDGAEANTHLTDPLVSDTDEDGLTDGAEVNTHGTDPLVSDSDGDGLVDGEEVNVYATNPLNDDSDGDDLSDGAEVHTHTTDPLSNDSDDDGLADGAEIAGGSNPLIADQVATTLYVDTAGGSDSYDGLAATWQGGTRGPKETIQAAIAAATPGWGYTIEVADGTYTGVSNKDLDFGGKAITVRSANGPHTCIIDCENGGRGFYFHSGETPTSALDGFTITNGNAPDHGGSEITIVDYPDSATGELYIPSSFHGKPVTAIGSSAFDNCTGLTSVALPAGVTSIGGQAFSNCTGLTALYLLGNAPTNVGSGILDGSDYVIVYRFVGATGFSTTWQDRPVVTLSDHVASIGIESCPAGAVGTFVIPSNVAGKSVTAIGDSAFHGCAGLNSVTVPAGVTSIGDQAFSNCTGLTVLCILGDAPTDAGTDILNGSDNVIVYRFFGATGFFTTWQDRPVVTLTDHGASIGIDSCSNGAAGTFVIPSSIAGKPVTTIENNAFESCYRLTNVIISAGVTSIGDSAFYYCTGLTSVTIPSSVTSVGYSAFRRCRDLTSVTIPSGVTSIGGYAFADCTGLTSVTIPASVTSIGNYAFYNCSGLAHAYFLGDAPATGGTGVFFSANQATVYCFDEATGFTTPTWQNRPVVRMGSSSLVIDSVTLSGDDVTLHWNGIPGVNYTVQWSTDLLDWNDVPVGDTSVWTDVGGASGTEKYYRLVILGSL